MKKATPNILEIALTPERLDVGTREECACFGLFSIETAIGPLTAGIDWFVNSYRRGPLVSGYHAAEWFAWNWWRLRFEAPSTVPDWWRAHRMTAIGEGYVWPNLTIFSDGVRTMLLSEASSPDAKLFRYLGARALVLPSTQFEAAINLFMSRILGRLRESAIEETNFDCIWRDVLAERSDPARARARARRLEALLGRDADAVEDAAVARLLADEAALGEQAVEELAAEAAQGGALMDATELREIAQASGFERRPHDMVCLDLNHVPPSSAETPAWQLGAIAARALREQERLGDGPISNERLAELAGAEAQALAADTPPARLSFSLDGSASESRFVLRSRWETGRRFDLARLLADQIVAVPAAHLHAATRAHTYRQKMQRAFAAELLSPFEAVDSMLNGDLSAEAQQDVAAHFQVSDRTILTLLVNHRRLERGELGSDLDAAA